MVPTCRPVCAGQQPHSAPHGAPCGAQRAALVSRAAPAAAAELIWSWAEIYGDLLFMAVDDFGGVLPDGAPRPVDDMSRSLYVYNMSEPRKGKDLLGLTMLVGAKRRAGSAARGRGAQQASAGKAWRGRPQAESRRPPLPTAPCVGTRVRSARALPKTQAPGIMFLDMPVVAGTALDDATLLIWQSGRSIANTSQVFPMSGNPVVIPVGEARRRRLRLCTTPLAARDGPPGESRAGFAPSTGGICAGIASKALRRSARPPATLAAVVLIKPIIEKDDQTQASLLPNLGPLRLPAGVKRAPGGTGGTILAAKLVNRGGLQLFLWANTNATFDGCVPRHAF